MTIIRVTYNDGAQQIIDLADVVAIDTIQVCPEIKEEPPMIEVDKAPETVAVAEEEFIEPIPVEEPAPEVPIEVKEEPAPEVAEEVVLDDEAVKGETVLEHIVNKVTGAEEVPEEPEEKKAEPPSAEFVQV